MTKAHDLEQLRIKIDALDAELMNLINQRAHLVQDVAKAKNSAGETVNFYRPEREAQILKKVISENQGPLPNSDMVQLFREIISACLALEQTLNIAYLGPPGTFTQIAASKHFGHSVTFTAFTGIEQVFREVSAGSANYGVVPVENSIEGVVNHTLDLLYHSNLLICGEVELPIHHHLLSQTTALNELTQVYAHQQSLAQCRSWLETHLTGVERIAVTSNADAARIASDKKQSAAIASEAAGELYGLNRLACNIEDEADNTTRFLVIGKEHCPPCSHDKTSLLFSVPNKPGALYQLLSCFANNNVSMTRIESRPSRQEVWDYVFFVDIAGHAEDEKVRCALSELKEQAAMLKLLGSYPRAIL